MGDLRDRVGEGMAALERLVQRIPGFKGYQDRENRRDADKLLREHLVGLLNQTRHKLSRFQSQLSAEGQFKPVTDLNRVSRRLARIRDRIQHAGYGYAGIFDAVKIDEAALDRLYQYDLSLQEYLGKVDEAAAGMVSADAETRTDAIAALADVLDELDRMVDHRNEAAAQLAP